MTGNLVLDIYDDVDDGGGGNQIVEEFTLDEPSSAENGDLFVVQVESSAMFPSDKNRMISMRASKVP